MQPKITSKNNTSPVRNSQKKAIPTPATRIGGRKKSEKTKAGNLLNKVSFWLRYTTQYGQEVYLVGNHEILGNNTIANAIALTYFNDNYWTVTLDFTKIQIPSEGISYHYLIKQPNGDWEHEWGTYKKIQCSDQLNESVTMIDSWNYTGYIENIFETEPFQQVLLKKQSLSILNSTIPQTTATHDFKVKAPLVSQNQTICLLGSGETLGNWQTNEPVLMQYDASTGCYQISLDFSEEAFPIAYKYGIFDIVNNQFVQFEEGNNRVVHQPAVTNTKVRYHDGFVWIPNTTWKGTGVAIPVFSIRTLQSFGVGEFHDIKKMVDWAERIGLKMIQLLPVNDTTAHYQQSDSYPYAAISAFALHPMYLHLPSMADEQGMRELAELEPQRTTLNASPTVDYINVNAVKQSFCKKLYERIGKATLQTESFKKFFTHNEYWLKPYAAFCYFRDLYGSVDFTSWPNHLCWNEADMNGYFNSDDDSPESMGMGYYCYQQYHLYLQLKEATEYAHSKGVIVKGDIAIGVFRNGADVWQQPELFQLHFQAGAPPDDFAKTGQNWGFPTYNWNKMRETSFAWWKQRFTQMGDYFDAFRIDHILGFFRIWSIPIDAIEGIMGHFVPALPIHQNELTDRGIHLSEQRLTQPFINEQVLWQVFGYDNELVKSIFLEPIETGIYQLKPSFTTQVLVEKYFSDKEKDQHHLTIKKGLFRLISNVLFFKDEENEHAFHFRYAVNETSSFQLLPDAYKAPLYELYLDYFYKRQDEFWKKEALQKLPALKRETNMMICGEDLGMVPGCVPDVMQQLGLLSLEIQRMPKNPDYAFFHPNNAPYLSVVTPSTHDMSTIRGWWEEDRAKTEQFYHSELGQSGDTPYYCEAWINKAIVVQHLYSPAMWCVFQLQDLLGIDAVLRRTHPEEERINIPADPNHYWNYRMHITLESLLEANGFNDEISYLIKASGR
ncbi:MAG: 4-alpha-glucanotransferase [Chitinophagia bacterium]